VGEDTEADAGLREQVRSRYAGAALTVLGQADGGDGCCGDAGGCCAPAGPLGALTDGAGTSLYREGETDGLPEDALTASMGCGNPLAVAELCEGERVLNLGSGGGIDVLLSARRVGPSGHAYGVDMTDEMLALARANARQASAANVTFLKGQIEAVTTQDSRPWVSREKLKRRARRRAGLTRRVPGLVDELQAVAIGIANVGGVVAGCKVGSVGWLAFVDSASSDGSGVSRVDHLVAVTDDAQVEARLAG
jgi:SAM-dependent methyltransferase